jgi:hypothetical protein
MTGVLEEFEPKIKFWKKMNFPPFSLLIFHALPPK